MAGSLREQIDQVFSGYGSELLAWKSWGMNAVEKTHDLKVESVDQILSLIIKVAEALDRLYLEDAGFKALLTERDRNVARKAIQAMIKEME